MNTNINTTSQNTSLPTFKTTLIVYGSIEQVTRGSGGKYNDECTSGHDDPVEQPAPAFDKIAND